MIVALDLVPISTSRYTIVNDETITVDLPQAGSLGFRTLSVQKGTDLAFSNIQIVAPSNPTLQAGNGDPLNPVTGTVEVTVAGPVGEVEYVAFSLSNLPSVFLPFAQLEIGNNFTDLNLLNIYTIPASGWISETFPLTGAGPIYMQALTLAQGLPAADSNVSSFEIVP